MTRIRIAAVIIAVIAVTILLLVPHALALLLRLPARNRIPRLWHRLVTRLIGIRIHLFGERSDTRPLMIVSNHVSWKDILVLGAAENVTFVAKAEVKDWPVFGWLARLQRTIFVEREAKRKSGEQANEMAERLAAGEIVVLFPEGTTGDGNRVLETKSTLYAAATAAVPFSPTGTVHVQPVALAYTRLNGLPMGHYHRPVAAWPGDVGLLPHLWGVLKEGAIDVEVCLGTPVAVTAETNRKHLAAQCDGKIREMLAHRLRGRPFEP